MFGEKSNSKFERERVKGDQKLENKNLFNFGQKIIFMCLLVFIFGLGFGAKASAADFRLLFGGRHAYGYSQINAQLGTGHIPSDIQVHSTDMNTSSVDANSSRALNETATYYNETGAAIPSAAPYQLYNTSATGYTGDSIGEYNSIVPNGLAHNYAYLPSAGNTTPPLAHFAPADSAEASSAGAEWSLGTADWGVTSLSVLTSVNAQLLMVARYRKPGWNWFDVKSAIRQTLPNWPTGYNGSAYGFGALTQGSFDAAMALSDAEIVLQPPVAKLSDDSQGIDYDSPLATAFELYPSLQTRRVKEVLFRFSSDPGFQASELSLSEIEALGGEKVEEYTGTLAKKILLKESSAGNYYAWLTADNSNDSLASFSRIDTYSVIGPITCTFQYPAGSTLFWDIGKTDPDPGACIKGFCWENPLILNDDFRALPRLPFTIYSKPVATANINVNYMTDITFYGNAESTNVGTETTLGTGKTKLGLLPSLLGQTTLQSFEVLVNGENVNLLSDMTLTNGQPQIIELTDCILPGGDGQALGIIASHELVPEGSFLRIAGCTIGAGGSSYDSMVLSGNGNDFWDQVDIENNVFLSGDILMALGITKAGTSTINIVNNTIKDTLPNDGGGIWVTSSGVVPVAGSSMTYNIYNNVTENSLPYAYLTTDDYINPASVTGSTLIINHGNNAANTANSWGGDFVRGGADVVSATFAFSSGYEPSDSFSPLVDAGRVVAGRTSDSVGNPIYGLPDIGAFEYQPPYSMGTNEVDTSANVRVYGDGKFRNTATAGGATANLSVIPQSSQTTKWLDITKADDESAIIWEESRKKWKETSTTLGSTDTLHAVGDLTAGKSYSLRIDNALAIANITSTDCTNGVCTADGNGKITFTYTGGYSDHVFEIIDDIPPTIILTSLETGNAIVNFAITTSESATCKYSTTSGTAYGSMTGEFSVSDGTSHSTTISGLSNGQSYNYYVRCEDTSNNANTNDYIISFFLASLGGGGLPSEASNPPSAPIGGFKIILNQGVDTTANRIVAIDFKAGSDVDKFAISLTSDFKDASLENYSPNKQIDLCSKFGGVIKSPICPDGQYTVYVKYFTSYGVPSSIISSTINLKTSSVREDDLSIDELAEEANLINDHNLFVNMDETPRLIDEKLTSGIKSGLIDKVKFQIAFFIQNGTRTTRSLGAGERAGVLSSYISVFNKVPTNLEEWKDVLKIANGRWLKERNTAKEQSALATFKKIYLRDANRSNPHDDAAITVFTYGLRPANRNMESEKFAIKTFRHIYKSNPHSTVDWDIVRAIAYSGAKR